MPISKITALENIDIPQRNQQREVFRARANSFFSALPTYHAQLNQTAEDIETLGDEVEQVKVDVDQLKLQSAQTLADSNQLLLDSQSLYNQTELTATHTLEAADNIYQNISLYTNYKGDWVELTGALSIPSVVRHNGSFWQLLVNLADVTTSEPDLTSSDWTLATAAPISGGDIGDVVYSPTDLEGTTGKYFECDGRVLLQSSYPTLFSKLGVGDQPAPSSLLPVPSNPPNGASQGITVSPENTYVAVTHSLAPFLSIYKRNGNTFTKLPDPAYLPTFRPNQISFSHNGEYLAVGVNTAPRVVIYKRSGDTFTKLPDPSQLPSGVIISVKFSPDDTYLVMGYTTSPYTFVYKRNGDTFTKLPDLPATASTVNGIDFSNNIEYLALAHSLTPYLTIMKRDGDTFTKLPNPSQLPPLTGNKVSFSSDNTYLALSHSLSPHISVYKRDGDTFTKLPDTFGLSNNTEDVDFSPDTEYLAVGLSGIAQNVNVYKRIGDTFTKLPNFTSYGVGSLRGVVFGSNRDYLFCASQVDAQLHIYKVVHPFNPETEFALPQLLAAPQDAVSGWLSTPMKAYIRSES